MGEEGLQDTENKMIHIGKPIEFDKDSFRQKLDELNDAANRDDKDIRKYVKGIVDTYRLEAVGAEI